MDTRIKALLELISRGNLYPDPDFTQSMTRSGSRNRTS